MTRQFLATQEELVQREAGLTHQIDQNEVEIKSLEAQKTEIQQKKKEIEEEKDLAILDLRKHIDKLSGDFQIMLKDTLEKMKHRIDKANKQWEDENEAKML